MWASSRGELVGGPVRLLWGRVAAHCVCMCDWNGRCSLELWVSLARSDLGHTSKFVEGWVSPYKLLGECVRALSRGREVCVGPLCTAGPGPAELAKAVLLVVKNTERLQRPPGMALR